MAIDLRNQVWLVTGASRGIGADISRVAARGGAKVALVARDTAALEALAAELGGAATPISADLSQSEDCEMAVRTALDHFGRLDVLVANAGLTMHALFEQAASTIYRRLMDLNYFGVVDTVRAALPALKQAQGRIVAVSSIAGLHGVPTRTGYSASKFALMGFCEALRIELATTGVSVTVVAPGFIDTGIQFRALGPDGRPIGEAAIARPQGMSSMRAAQAIVRAAHARRRELWLTPESKVIGTLRRISPRLVDFVYQQLLRRGRV
jgi:NAD(P)-dependent dehydrogenase (short-subunit alcohol dehydrogenase family)